MDDMKCDHTNGYVCWETRDKVTGARIEYVLWVDPDANEWATVDMPPRLSGGEVAKTVHRAQEIIVDVISATFWVLKAPVTIPPLRPSRQEEQEATNKPCEECKQPQTCRRLDYCAAHRGPFGQRAP
jgi:hypothetical protein